MPASAADPGRDPIVSIVVVTYNNADVVGRCLDAISSSATDYPFEVIVVDNASGDRTRATVESASTPPLLISLPRNIGFAGAVNAAVDRAAGRHLVLVNSDAFVDPGCVDVLVDTLERRPRAGIVGAKLRYPSGRLQPSAGTFPSLLGSLWVALYLHRMPLLSRVGVGYFANRRLYRAARQVDWVTAGVCAARMELTPLPARSFMYGEDVEWARRARDSGFEVWLQPAATAVHVGQASVELSQDVGFAQRRRVQFELDWFAARGRGVRVAARMIMVAHGLARLIVQGLPSLLLGRGRRPAVEQLALLRAAVAPVRRARGGGDRG